MENQRTPDLWTNVDATVTDAVRRLRRRSAGWWRDEAPGAGGTRADRVAALVADLARRDPTAGGRTPPRPDRDETLVDQLVVVARDVTRAEGVAPEDVERALNDCLRAVDPRP